MTEKKVELTREELDDNGAKKTEEVQEVVTGTHVLTGQPIKKQVKVQPAQLYNTGDRAPYVVIGNITGSLNGRTFNLKKGEVVNLNVDEATLLASYVAKGA